MAKRYVFNYPNGQIESILYNDLIKSKWGDTYVEVNHRTDGPSQQNFYLTGQIKYEKYCFEGELHRLDGPAEINYHSSGVRILEKYAIDGKLHRTDGPALIDRHQFGNIRTVAFYISGSLHRIGKPALIIYDANGNPIEERYHDEGVVSNLLGPAMVKYEYDDDGAVVNKSRTYWVDGYEMPFSEFLRVRKIRIMEQVMDEAGS
jgi:hypothetical protein